VDQRIEKTASGKATHYITCNFDTVEVNGARKRVVQEKQVYLDEFNRLHRGARVNVTYLPSNPNIWTMGKIENPLGSFAIWGLLTAGSFGIGFTLLMLYGLKESMLGFGVLAVTVGGIGFISSFLENTDSNRAIWKAFEIFGEMVGSVRIASILAVVFGLALILLALGYEELKKPGTDHIQPV
jgi:hypothetical protein